MTHMTHPRASDDEEENNKRLELIVKRHKQPDNGVQSAVVRGKATLGGIPFGYRYV